LKGDGKFMFKKILLSSVLLTGALGAPTALAHTDAVNKATYSVSTNEFWLSDGNPIKYHPHFNSFIGIADFSETPESSFGQVIFEFYDLKGDLVYETSATVYGSSTYQAFTAPVTGIEEGSYSVKVKSINLKVDPNSVKISHVN
jgi:hypothetical protein